MAPAVTPTDKMGPLLSDAIDHFADAGAVRVWIAYGPGKNPAFSNGILHLILQYQYDRAEAEAAVDTFAEQQIEQALQRGGGLFSGMNFEDADVPIERVMDLEARDTLRGIAQKADYVRFEGRTWPLRIDVTPTVTSRPQELAPLPENAFLVHQADDDHLEIEDRIGLNQVRQYCEQLRYGYQPDQKTDADQELIVEAAPSGGMREYIEVPEDILEKANIDDRSSITLDVLDGFIAIRRGTGTQRYKPLNQETVTDTFTAGI